MKRYLDQLNEWLAQLQPRERAIVVAGAAAGTVLLLYLALWQPLAHAHRQRAAALDESRTLAAKLEVASAALQRAHQSGAGANLAVSLLSAVDQSSKSPSLGKPPSRIQPEGDKSVNVWIEDVPFDNLVRWMNELEMRFGIVAVTADIERQSGVGLVNAHLSLARP